MDNKKCTGEQLGRISASEYRSREKRGVAVVLDNVRSAFNVGSVFRSCDAFAVDKLYLCGICAVPPSAEIHKSALGAEASVEWEHCPDTLQLVERLRAEGWTVVSVEQTVRSQMLDSFEPEPGRRYALIFGNEVDGVRQEVVDASDLSLEIPQWGTKHSLNVSVAAGVVLWKFKPERI